MRYKISSQDTIIEVNEAWVDFAVANDVPDLEPSQVLGQPLWRFISGAEVQHLYELLLSRVRHTQGTLVLPFRCDAPALRRFMELAMTAQPDGAVELITWLVRTEPRDAVSLLTPGGEPGQPLLAICSWCKRIRLAETAWVEVEEAVVRLGLFQMDVLPQLTHGVCPDCYAAVMRALSARPEEASHGTLGERERRT
jgi:hypothetical protein